MKYLISGLGLAFDYNGQHIVNVSRNGKEIDQFTVGGMDRRVPLSAEDFRDSCQEWLDQQQTPQPDEDTDHTKIELRFSLEVTPGADPEAIAKSIIHHAEARPDVLAAWQSDGY